MGPLHNSLWKVVDAALELPSQFRILRVYGDLNLVVIYAIDVSAKKLQKPCAAPLSAITELIHDKSVIQGDFESPTVVCLPDDELDEIWKRERDARYKLIQPLVEDPDFLLRLVTQQRSADLVQHAATSLVPLSTIHRLLNRYWRFGQQRSALVPMYINCGGRAKPKRASDKKRGAPRKQSLFGFQMPRGINISEGDKILIARGIEEHFADKKKNKKSSVYATVMDQYADEILSAESDGRPAEVPNYRQICYWMPRLVNEIELDKKLLGEKLWEKDHRALLGSVSSLSVAPGDCYEIDSTVADVYIVSEVDREVVLGRPVIYIVIDQASRLVTGIHVSIFAASFAEAKKALHNAFIPKEEFCKALGITLEDNEWPCAHVPRRLLADRAEFLGVAAEEHTGPLGLQTDLASALRGDWKAVVERRFGIANEDCLHDLAGTTRGQIRKRGEPVPQDDAFYTLKEITALLVRLYLDANRTQQLDALVVRPLIAANLAPTPINYWNWYVDHHLDSLTSLDPDQVSAELLPSVDATVTPKGIKADDLYYTCEQAEREGWFVRARKNGSWELSARADNNSDYLWVRPARGQRLVRCQLLPRCGVYANLPRADVIYIKEWKKNKAQSPDRLAAKIKFSSMKKGIDESAAKDTKSSSTGKTHKEKRTGLRENRRREQEMLERASHSRTGISVDQSNWRVDPDERVMELIREVCSDGDADQS